MSRRLRTVKDLRLFHLEKRRSKWESIAGFKHLKNYAEGVPPVGAGGPDDEVGGLCHPAEWRREWFSHGWCPEDMRQLLA